MPGNESRERSNGIEPFELDFGGLTWPVTNWSRRDRIRQIADETPQQWQREYLGEWANDTMHAMPEPTTWRLAPRSVEDDIFEFRMSSYANVVRYNPVATFVEPPRDAPPPFDEAWIQAHQNRYYRDNCWSSGSCESCDDYRRNALVEYEQMYGRDRHKDWVRLWGNIGLAHTAAIFILEVHYDGKEQRIANADAIRATIGA